MQPFHLDNYYLTWVDALGTFHVPSMFNLLGLEEASKASDMEIMDA